jgi:diguanylate cyclase (GGDEF)-like protein
MTERGEARQSSPIPRGRIAIERLRHNRRAILWLAALSFAASLVLLIQHLYWPVSTAPDSIELEHYYVVIYLSALVLTPLFWAVAYAGFPRALLPGYTLLSWLFSLLFITALTLLSLLDSAARTDTAPFILGIMLCAGSFRASRVYYVTLIGGAALLFILTHALLWGAIDVNSLVTLTIVTAFALWLSFRLEQQRVETFRVRVELSRRNHLLSRLSATDPLTGVLNRRTLDQRLRIHQEEYLRYGTPFAVVLLDLDHFKQVNDTHGHQAGDAVLIELAERISCSLRIGDELARYGGEEFLVILPHLSLTDALEAAERLRLLIAEQPFTSHGIPVTASIGVAEQLAQDEEVAALLRRADSALFSAKERGRNCVAPAITESKK